MYNDKNAAYDFSALEEKKVQRRRKRNVVKFPKKKELIRRQLKAKIITIILSSVSIAVAVGAVAVFINGQVKLTELTENTTKVSKELKESENLYTQLAIKKESARSLENIGKKAKNELGMEKVDASKIEYINVMCQDKGEIKSENKGFFEGIKNMFLGFMS